MTEDIRWQHRFSNYRKALERLEDFLEPYLSWKLFLSRRSSMGVKSRG